MNQHLSRLAQFGIWGVVFVLALTAVHRRALADGPTVDSDDISRAKIDSANTRLLQRKVDEQQREITLLRAEIAALKAQLQSMGLTPVTDATTRPALSRAKRISFIYAQGTADVDREIHQAVDELDHDQWFNAYTLYVDSVQPYQPHFVEASDLNKQKFRKDFRSEPTYGHLMSALTVAAQAHPDLIWVVGPSHVDQDEDQFIRDLHKVLPGSHIRIDTALDFMSHDPRDLHLYWRISHETGGVCVDKDGNPMDEPALPLSAPAPPPQPQPQTPSILRDKP
ncbi:MAG: hypothetical protein ABSB74_17645 [Tepidisphaeraceae bacterium]